MGNQIFETLAEGFVCGKDYIAPLANFGLTSIDAIFRFEGGLNLAKKNLDKHRSRIMFKIENPPVMLFLKRYDNPPKITQLKNWLCRRSKASCGWFEADISQKLSRSGINTPKVIASGWQQGLIFEKRSFVITEQIKNGQALEKRLPDYFNLPPAADIIHKRRHFIKNLAHFCRRFHDTGYRHRDFYLAHIFFSDDGCLHLIDLQRVFKPYLFAERFRVKDVAQLYYSAPAKYFKKTDRLRFYLAYAEKNKLQKADKTFLRKVLRKAKRIARHDIRHGRSVPFAI